jgi:hypothetical protein
MDMGRLRIYSGNMVRVDRGSSESFYDLNVLSNLILRFSALREAQLRRKYLALACNCHWLGSPSADVQRRSLE